MKKMCVKIAVLTVAASAMVLLTSCSKTPSDNNTYGSGGSQTYGMHSGNYQTDSQGFRINSLTAPSNQTYYFGFNESNVRQQDMQALMIQAKYLAMHSNATVRLEGNTDNRGSREYNIGLGWNRDKSVAAILEQQGVKASQIQMVSYGKENPAVPGNDAHAWALNRRVDFIYKNKG